MAELYGLTVDPNDFIPFTGTGEANFLGEASASVSLQRVWRVQQFVG